ncbi:galactosylceramide sulfotransferase-like [Branchiostoma floridae x Branchiostoma japonicum]
MSSKSCHPRRKFVFIKTHKTGSCTAVNIFQRYAISHHLSVLMPTGGNMLAWPFPPAEEDYVHTPDEQYDVLLSHMVYNKTWLRTKFPANTAYISIIREPSSHLRSAMNFYRLPELLKIKSKNPVQTFLQDPWKYKDLFEAYFDFCNVTWDGTRNFLSFDLGYPTDGAEDKERARRYTGQLEVDFTTMLIMENLDESLILLRRLMCWEVRDVLYDMTPKNSRNYSYKEYVSTAEELANLRRWKAVDYLLYDTFNASLWRKIAAQGPDFHDELRYFKELNKRVSTYCDKRTKDEPDLTVAASKWNSEFQPHLWNKCGYRQWSFNKALKPSHESKKPSISKPLDKKKKTVNATIPYIQGVSEKLRRILQNFNIATNFKPHSTLRQKLVHPKDRVQKGTKSDVIYRLKCEGPQCNDTYIGETSQPLKAS